MKGPRLAARDVAILAIISSMLIVGKYALQFVPNVEVVTTMVIAFSYVFGYKTVIATLLFCLIDMILYPFSPDVVVAYFVHWNALALISATLSRRGYRSINAYLVVGLVMTVLFGVLTSATTSLIIGTPFRALYLSGLVFFALHVVSTLVFMLVGFRPIVRIITNIYPEMSNKMLK